MAKLLRYVGELTGGNKPMLLGTKITNKKNFKKGEPVFVSDLKNHDFETNGIFGVAAEDYEKEENELCPSYGNGILKVNKSPDSVYKIDAIYVTAYDYFDMYLDTADILIGESNKINCKFGLMLVEKAEMSGNPYEIGEIFAVREIQGTSEFSTLVTDKFPYAYEGDKYMLIPYVGNKYMHLTTAGEVVFDCRTEGNLEVLEVDTKEKTYTVRIKHNA